MSIGVPHASSLAFPYYYYSNVRRTAWDDFRRSVTEKRPYVETARATPPRAASRSTLIQVYVDYTSIPRIPRLPTPCIVPSPDVLYARPELQPAYGGRSCSLWRLADGCYRKPHSLTPRYSCSIVCYLPRWAWCSMLPTEKYMTKVPVILLFW